MRFKEARRAAEAAEAEAVEAEAVEAEETTTRQSKTVLRHLVLPCFVKTLSSLLSKERKKTKTEKNVVVVRRVKGGITIFAKCKVMSYVLARWGKGEQRKR